MRKLNGTYFLLVLVLLMMGQVVHAATDGTLGTTSTGTSAISLTKLNSVRISSVNDMAFGSVVSAPASSFDVCIYSTTGNYTVAASSANGTGSLFRVRSGLTYITYDVEWNNVASGSSGTNLDHGITSATFSGASTTSQTCGGGENARVFVNVDSVSFGTATAGTYADTLTMMVSPI